MLAGRMKLNHFLIIGGIVGAVGITGTYFACKGGGDSDKDKKQTSVKKDKPAQDKPAQDKPVAKPEPAKPTPKPPEPVKPAGDELPEVDKVVLGWAGKDLGAKKKKDVTKGRPFKVSLYQDKGKSTVNRAKVDLDRDGKWDQKYTFKGTAVTRKSAPGDDEKYTKKERWDGKAWVSE